MAKPKVTNKVYDWGNMVTVHDGIFTTYPLEPEHVEKIKNLEHNDSVMFRDHTGTLVTAKRIYDDIKFKKRGSQRNTFIDYNDFVKKSSSKDIEESTLLENIITKYVTTILSKE